MHFVRAAAQEAPRAAWQRACFAMIMRAGYALRLTRRLPTRDRAVLENIILPHYASRADMKRILFVGCRWYTRDYEKMFDHAQYWTLERCHSQARYGARHHVTAALENLLSHFPKCYFDLIVCNGVFGWGLDDRAACERAFEQCLQVLRPGGEFVLGWNDVPAYRPCDPGELNAIQRFESVAFEPLGKRERVLVPRTNRHIYAFLRRPCHAPDGSTADSRIDPC